MGRHALAPSRLSVLLAVIVVALSLSTPASALPGIGGLAKKAKEKAAKAAGVEDKEAAVAGDNNVEFDEDILELTDARLDRVIATFKKASAAATGRPALAAKMDKTTEERVKLWDKEGDAVMAMQNKRDDIKGCYEQGYREATDRRMQEYSQKALTDPTIREKFTRIAQQHNAAAAAGDSAAIKAAQEGMHSVMLATPEDSATVRKNCGPIPSRMGAEDKLDALDKQIASLAEQIRQIDEKVSEAQAEGGGMERHQFAMAAERIQMYLAWRKSKSYSKSSTRGFTKEEIEAMEKRLEELVAALG
jgi:hypothetical protein